MLYLHLTAIMASAAAGGALLMVTVRLECAKLHIWPLTEAHFCRHVEEKNADESRFHRTVSVITKESEIVSLESQNNRKPDERENSISQNQHVIQ